MYAHLLKHVVIEACGLFQAANMSILQYFKKTNCADNKGGTINFPDPRGSLVTTIPSTAIASANCEIRCLMNKKQKHGEGNRRGNYNKYTSKQRATVGKFDVEHGVMSAKKKISIKFKMDINESSVRLFKSEYLKERRRKLEADED